MDDATGWQPWEAFHPNGVIIFSDILTPLPAFGVPFDIEEVRGSQEINERAAKSRNTDNTAIQRWNGIRWRGCYR
ncbi:uroporphyrinogen decarboxylase 1, chloroplastic [Tanacetum coccineum]